MRKFERHGLEGENFRGLDEALGPGVQKQLDASRWSVAVGPELFEHLEHRARRRSLYRGSLG